MGGGGRGTSPVGKLSDTSTHKMCPSVPRTAKPCLKGKHTPSVNHIFSKSLTKFPLVGCVLFGMVSARGFPCGAHQGLGTFA